MNISILGGTIKFSIDGSNISFDIVVVGFIIIFIALGINFKNIFDFLGVVKKAKITKLVEALKCEFVTGLTREHLQEDLATEHFKLTTGINLEKPFREKIIQSHKATNGELSFTHFKNALPYLFFKNNKISVKISGFTKFSYWLNIASGIILVIFGLFLVCLSSLINLYNQTNEFTLIQQVTIFGTGWLFIVVSIFPFSQIIPVNSAKRVDRWLSKIADNQSTTNTSRN